MRMVPPRLQKRMVSSVHAGKRQFGVGHFGRPKGRARGQMGLKKHFGVSQIESKKNSKYFISHLHSIGRTSIGVVPDDRCQHLVVAAAVFQGQSHHPPARLGHVRVPRERRVVQLMLMLT